MAKTRNAAPARKPAKKAPARKKATTKKKTTKKKTTRKKVAKKSTARTKASTKKSTKKKPAKKTAKKKAAVKKGVKKKVSKKPTTKKKTTKKKTTKRAAAQSKSTANGTAKPAPTKKPKAPTLEEMTLEQRMELDWTESKLRRVKSGLSRKDLAEYRAMLLEKRAEIVGDVQGMERSRSASLEDIAHMPLHMADVGTDTFEQEFTLGLIESERRLLAEINDALHRMQNKTYGVCLASGLPIGKARLEFKPWAKYCIDVARLREKRGL